jgi:prephenate dehydrogenase/chorismate mutase/prephenate dehydrogenase
MQLLDNGVKSSIPALTADASSDSNERPKNITIIGGSGRMGQLFVQQLSAAGHNVSILGSKGWDDADTLLSRADLVLVSVPIERTIDIIKLASKYLSPTTALADITSIKTQPLQAMLEYHQGPVIGLHPMFGPKVESFDQQKFVVCPGRNDETFEWLLDWIIILGGNIIVCTPEEHDRIMVFVQATQHFSRFSLGAFVAQEQVDLNRSLLLSTPNYQQEIDIVKRLFAQNPQLCVEIMLATEERCHAIARLASTYSRLAQLVEQKDRSGLIQEFEKAQEFISNFRF